MRKHSSILFMTLAAISCCICTFCSCSDDSFENVEATNLKASDCLNATYVKNEQGSCCPQKLNPLSISSFEAEVASRTWDVDASYHINENGKTEKNDYDGATFSDIVFRENGACTMFEWSGVDGMNHKATSSYTYNASNGYFSAPESYTYGYILGIETSGSKHYMWFVESTFLVRYVESTEAEIVKQHPNVIEGYN